MKERLRILEGDVLDRLKELPDNSVHCCVTSPPYWGLRDYGVPGQIGLEKTPEEYVAKMVEVFREVRRVLRDDGTCWVNLGDSYAASRSYQVSDNKNPGAIPTGHDSRCEPPPGLKQKDLCGIPWRVALALQADGWYLRSDIIWHKPNPMPESVTDRPTKSHEYIFLLTKSGIYFYDAEAIKEPQSAGTHERFGKNPAPSTKRKLAESGSGIKNNGSFDASMVSMILEGGRNKRSVWTVPSQAYSEAHFATFPEDLIKPCIMAGTSSFGCCPKCGAPWERIVEKSGGTIGKSWHDHKDDLRRGQRGDDECIREGWINGDYQAKTIGWKSGCECFGHGSVIDAYDFKPGEKPIPCTVLDPFFGSGTSGKVALELGRACIGIELNPDYCKLAHNRCDVTPGLALA